MNILDKFLEFKKLPYVLAGVIFLCSLAVLSCFKSAETQLNTLNQAVSFSRMMTKSSDDLTNYARYYVTTKNEQWKTEFNNVLKVRNGELADEKGIVKSFKDRLKEVPFLQSELDTLLKAEQLSNNLAKLEIEAFDWTQKGKIELNFDIQTHHHMAAQLLMFGDDYNKHKNQIIQTTNEFYASVVNRLQSQYLFYMTTAWTMIIVINLSLILLVMVINHKDITVAPKRIVRKKPAAKKAVRQVNKTSKQLKMAVQLNNTADKQERKLCQKKLKAQANQKKKIG